jgi:uncharacterized protein (DUF58 family)
VPAPQRGVAREPVFERPLRAVQPALWLSTRGIYGLLAVATVIAVASVVPAIVPVALFVVAAYVALLVADIALGPKVANLRVRREPMGYVALRVPSRVRYAVENAGTIALRVGLLESPVPIVTFDAPSLEVRVAERATLEAELGFLAAERGIATFGALYCWVENRVGLVRRRFRADLIEDVRVFPDLSAVEGYGNLARRRTLIEMGLRKIRMRGVGSDFESLREYVAGDAFRAIDWKASARRGRTMVAQYEIERSQQVLVVLDAGRLMTPRIGLQRKFDYALTAALSVGRVAQTAGDNVGLIAFGAKPILEIAPRRGAAHYNALAQTAYDLQPRLEEPDYETFFASLKQRYSKRSLVVFFTDMFDPVTSAAVLASMAVLTSRHLVMCVLMNDTAIANALAATPSTALEAYRTSVAMSLADERARSVATLRARGIIVVDVPAPKLTVSLLDAYLEVKAQGRI